MFTVGEVRTLSTESTIWDAISTDLSGGRAPAGRHRVRLVRFFHDYETGYRMIGELLDGDLAGSPAYFSGRQWDAAASTVEVSNV